MVIDMAERYANRPILTFTTTVHFWSMDHHGDRDSLIAEMSDLFAALKKRCGVRVGVLMQLFCVKALVTGRQFGKSGISLIAAASG
jgi:hypothetical protein